MGDILGHIEINHKREREMLLDMLADIQELIQPVGVFVIVVDTRHGMTAVFGKGPIKSVDARLYLRDKPSTPPQGRERT